MSICSFENYNFELICVIDEPLQGKKIDLGQGSCAWWPCHIGSNTTVGKQVSIGALAHIGRNVNIGSQTRIQGGAYIADTTEIGESVFIGPNVVILNDKYPPSKNSTLWTPVQISAHAVIGGNSTILPGVIIGEHAVIGAGSTVTKSVPSNEVWMGNPAQFHMTRQDYEKRRGA
jgi:UDP-2-acetamido-3-amino-2,3-dideoxy-glucuronate N-acetyltransferase